MVECPNCKTETLHEVLSGRIGGKAQTVFDSTVRCRECSHVHHITLKEEKPVEVPLIISWVKDSSKTALSLGHDEVVCVGEEVMCGDTPVVITSIESKGARVKKAKAADINTIWGKKFDKVRVLFSINHQGRTYSEAMLAIPDEEFCIGDILTVGKRNVVIHTIKLEDKTLKTGAARARDIVRIYGNIVRSTSH
jgi:uncharacterized Zn finger protein